MKMPSVVKRMGEAEGESQIYIEDYVCSYLNELRCRREELPLKAALFGYTCSKDKKTFYFIYGAACMMDEQQKGKCEEDVRKQFFSESDLIGYVNIYGENLRGSEKRNNYCIFYDTNEPMQNYLLSCYNRDGQEDVSEKEKEALKEVWKVPEKRNDFGLGNFIKKLLCFLLMLLLATAVTTIDEYKEIFGFMETAKRAVLVSYM